MMEVLKTAQKFVVINRGAAGVNRSCEKCIARSLAGNNFAMQYALCKMCHKVTL